GDGVLAEQHAAEHALLGREVLRRGALEGGLVGLGLRRELGHAHRTSTPSSPLTRIVARPAHAPSLSSAAGRARRSSSPVRRACSPSPVHRCLSVEEECAAAVRQDQAGLWAWLWSGCAQTGAALCT